jgi:hypothetical protein
MFVSVRVYPELLDTRTPLKVATPEELVCAERLTLSPVREVPVKVKVNPERLAPVRPEIDFVTWRLPVSFVL